MAVLHSFLCLLMFISGLLVCFSKSPIESVLFLILCFCNAAGILFIFNVEFLGLIFIIIYVGAIAVLFLFVIMMLNIKNKDDLQTNKNNGIFSFLYFALFYFFSFSLFLFIKKIFYQSEVFLLESKYNIFMYFDNLNNIDVMGQYLFNYFLVCFLIAGLILLIALIGAIVLTLRFNNTEESQHVNRQLSRTDNFLSFFK